MCRDEGMAVVPWGALGSGKFKTEAQRRSASKEGHYGEATEQQIAVSKTLEAIAERKGTLITSIAQAYVASKAPYVFPIVGCRTLEHLKGNIEALGIRLSEEEIREIEDVVPFDLRFPGNFFYGGNNVPAEPGRVWTMAMGGTIDHVPEPKPLSRA
ncbi:hypothetical protein OQA88_12590 [Cercophora sp. LCS_1]